VVANQNGAVIREEFEHAVVNVDRRATSSGSLSDRAMDREIVAIEGKHGPNHRIMAGRSPLATHAAATSPIRTIVIGPMTLTPSACRRKDSAPR
jgi:hypothetical protein